jgi:hypothetical protein
MEDLDQNMDPNSKWGRNGKAEALLKKIETEIRKLPPSQIHDAALHNRIQVSGNYNLILFTPGRQTRVLKWEEIEQ